MVLDAVQVPLAVLVQRKVALDVGGTLAKVCYVTSSPKVITKEKEEESISNRECLRPPLPPPAPDPTVESIEFTVDGRAYECRCCYFYTRRPETLVNFIQEHDLVPDDKQLRMTGGGAYKLSGFLEESLGVTVVRLDEMSSAMAGLALAMRISCGTFYYNLAADAKQVRGLPPRHPYPYMLVNIGSGVSILKCSRKGEFERISGTCIGGGTAHGLAKLCFGAQSFHEVAQLSLEGTDALDLNVADLIGDSAGSKVLPPDALASSFGRLGQLGNETEPNEVNKADIARSAIKMVSYNVGYLALLLARIHNVSRIYFAGKYISDHSFTMKTITQAVEFYSSYGEQPKDSDRDISELEWKSEPAIDNSSFDALAASLQFRSLKRSSKQEQRHEALFVRYDGYLGALGALTST